MKAQKRKKILFIGLSLLALSLPFQAVRPEKIANAHLLILSIPMVSALGTVLVSSLFQKPEEDELPKIKDYRHVPGPASSLDPSFQDLKKLPANE